jgi:hypothetical protein
MMSHCAIGANPDPSGGMRGIHSVYAQVPRTSVFIHSLKIVYRSPAMTAITATVL